MSKKNLSSLMDRISAVRSEEQQLLASIQKQRDDMAKELKAMEDILAGSFSTGNGMAAKPFSGPASTPKTEVTVRIGRPPKQIAGIDFYRLFHAHGIRFRSNGRAGNPSWTRKIAVALANGHIRLTNRGNGYLITVDCVLDYYNLTNSSYSAIYQALSTIARVYGLNWRSRINGDKCYAGIFVRE